MLETEPNNQNETARGTESDGGTAPSGVTGTASPGNASPGDASTGDASTGIRHRWRRFVAVPDGGGGSAAPPRRTRRPRRSATRAAGLPSGSRAPCAEHRGSQLWVTSSGPGSSR
jgi:hypothetical protein